MSVSDPGEPVRLDRWLWAARFYRTRRLAVEAINSGKVTHNGARVKPAKMLKPGDSLVIRRGGFEFDIQVQQCVDKRVSANLSLTLYEETEHSIARRRQRQLQRAADRKVVSYTRGRPTKRERRQMEKFKRSPFDD